MLTLALGSMPVSGDDCVPRAAPARVGDVIELEYGDDLPDAVVHQAIAYWRACPGYGTDFPSLVVGGDGIRRISVRRAEPSRVSSECGTFRGADIVLHDEALDLKGRPLDCGSLAQNLAHELGHVLGLEHLDDHARCRTHIMGVVTRGSAHGRVVSPEECIAAGARWLTARELDEARRVGYVDGSTFSVPLDEIDRRLNDRE